MITYDDLFPPGSPRPMGLCHVTGPPGVGKSTFAVSVGVSPERVAVLDAEQSLRIHHEALGFGVYHDLIAERTEKLGLTASPSDFFQHVWEQVEKLPEGLDVIVLDNIAPIEVGIQDMVETYPQRYGLTPAQVERGGGLKWGPIKNLYASFIQSLALKSKIYIFTSHLRQVWVGSRPVPGLYRPIGKQDVLERQTFLRLWLLYNPGGPVPSGLVLKSRLTQPTASELKGEILWQPLLPRKLPTATWGTIRGYFRNPPDWEKPAPGEKLTLEDWARLKGTLTPEQLEILRMAATADVAQEETREEATTSNQATVLPRTPAEFIVRISELNLTLPQALSQLGKELGDLSPGPDFLKLQTKDR